MHLEFLKKKTNLPNILLNLRKVNLAGGGTAEFSIEIIR